MRLARFNLTKIDNQQEWKIIFLKEYFSYNLYNIIYELTDLKLNFDYKILTPYLTILIALLLVSKLPTLSLKKISISSKTTVFLLLAAGIIFIALLFYTFETLLIFGLIYFISIPLSIFIYRNQQKKYSSKISDEDHEDIL